MSANCSRCGALLVTGARFCHACGRPVSNAGAAVASERRIVTVLFGDLSDFTAWAEDLDPERVGLVADTALGAMRTAVEEVGGHVDKLTGDGIMAVFGAPVAHEDDPERAVRAALAMQQAVSLVMKQESGGGTRLGLRVGLNTGEVVAGIQAQLSYTVVGDTVNTAARLSDAAEVGQVWAGRDTALNTMRVASWRTLPALVLKGKREPVTAFELVGLRPNTSTPSDLVNGATSSTGPLVGRAAELGLLVSWLTDALAQERSSWVTLTGEAGVGKTRLAEELARFAVEIPGVRLLWGRARSYGHQRSFAPLADWVRAACGLSDVDPKEEVVAGVQAAVDRLAQSGGAFPDTLTESLLVLLGAGQISGPQESATPGAGGAAEPVEAAALMLARLAGEGPLLLIADDLHWGLEVTLERFRQLVASLQAPLIALCIGRADGEDGWARALDPADRLTLSPLDPEAAARLLGVYLGNGELETESRDLLIARSRGNPFFLGELLRLLVDRGLLVREAAGWKLDQPVPADLLPSGVQALLSARIDALEPEAKRVLHDAAIAGVPFGPELLIGLDPAEVVQAGLSRLVSGGILAREAPGERYRFSHELIRDVAYVAIPKRQRAERHAVLAIWVSERPEAAPSQSDELVADQARHAFALAAEMELLDMPLLRRARAAGGKAFGALAQAAMDGGEPARAESLFSEALRLVDGESSAPLLAEQAVGRLLVGRAAVRVGLHRLSAAEEDLAGVLDSADLGLRAAALVVSGQLHRQRGEESAAITALVTAVALASDRGADRTTSEALRQLGLVHYLAGRLGKAEERFVEALELAERVGDSRGTGWALQHLTWSATTRGAYRQAEESLRRAASVFNALDDQRGLAWSAGTEAFVRLLQGRLREARSLARSLLPFGQAVGARWGMAVCLTIDAFAAAELGELRTAIEEAAGAAELFDELADPWGRSMALIARAFAERGAGNQVAAIELLDAAANLSADQGFPASGSLALTGLGYCELDRGRAEAARDAAARALDLLTPLDLEPSAKVGVQVLMAQALRGLGQSGDALSLLETATATSDEPSLIFPRRQALAHLAGALRETGAHARALETACRALQVPAEDIRSRVVALRVLALCLADCRDLTAARFALEEAYALACATEQMSERGSTRQAMQALAG